MVIHVRLEYLILPEENGHRESDAFVNVKACSRSRGILIGVISYTVNELCQTHSNFIRFATFEEGFDLWATYLSYIVI